MINPYAQAFMIATRTDHVVRPRLLAAGPAKTARPRGLRRWFRRKTEIDPRDL